MKCPVCQHTIFKAHIETQFALEQDNVLPEIKDPVYMHIACVNCCAIVYSYIHGWMWNHYETIGYDELRERLIVARVSSISTKNIKPKPKITLDSLSPDALRILAAMAIEEGYVK